MGIEYRASFARRIDRVVDATLRSRPSFSEVDRVRYLFRLAANPSAMPNVEVQIVDPESLYLCVYADDGSIVADLVAALGLTLVEVEG